ncbi:MAG: flagellar protein export ATPase FliI [Epsilonproteobacteria bacterium]|nr:flagellar protein export ATPase FliI [Campylobacterota bacterium]
MIDLLKIKKSSLSPLFGRVKEIQSFMIEVEGLKTSVGDVVEIVSKDKNELAMVTKVTKDSCFVSPFGFVEGIKTGDKVYLKNEGLQIPVGEELLGRVIDPFGNPKDGLGEIRAKEYASIIKDPIDPMKRGLINEIFEVGIKSIDGLLTTGKGQKVGIFAGSGVGKSTLMGMLVRGSKSPVKVIALIGERGREIPEFIHKNLKGDLSDTIIVAATSDDSPLMKKYGAFSAITIAEYFKDQGKDVLFMMDSVTRFAMAQREIGLALGEPPTSKGYPPSSLTILAQLMERAGKEEGKGSITAFFTVLVEGDDLSDPIADQARSILDGHIVLDRALTDYGIYPPVNILKSASRVMNDIVSKEHKEAAFTFRKLYSLLKENELVIRLGTYKKGMDPELDKAIEKKEFMENFLKQKEEERVPFEKTLELLKEIVL